MEPFYASNEEFDVWAKPPPPGDPPYAVDDLGLAYGPGLWPFRDADGTKGLASVHIAPSCEYRAWRNESVWVCPTQRGSGAEARVSLWLRRQGMGGYVLRVNVRFDLKRETFAFAPLEEPLRAQAASKAQRVLDLIRVSRQERDRGAKRPTTAHETWLRVEALTGVDPEAFSFTRRDLVAHWFQTALDEARIVWERRIQQSLAEKGGRGARVPGAGIAVHVGKKRTPVVVLEPPTQAQSASAWEEGVGDVVTFLRTKGILAHYHAGENPGGR